MAQEAMFDDREAMVWWWIPSKNLVTSDRELSESQSVWVRGSDNKNAKPAYRQSVF